MRTNKELMQQIETKRAELIVVATKEGFSAHRAVELSQQLDVLINEFNRRTSKNVTSKTVTSF